VYSLRTHSDRFETKIEIFVYKTWHIEQNTAPKLILNRMNHMKNIAHTLEGTHGVRTVRTTRFKETNNY
jgi:hypothetical protein